MRKRGIKRRSRVNDRIKRQKHKEAVTKYYSTNPEKRKDAVKKYDKKNPYVK